MESNLIRRVKSFNYPTLEETEIKKLEADLNVKIPNNFYQTAQVCDYQYMTAKSYEFYNVAGSNNYSVIGETLKLRNIGLPLFYICLGQQDDVLCILLNTINGSVIMCSAYDLYNFCEGKNLEDNPIIFKSFPEFFEYLLSEEEKSRSIPA